MRRLVAPLRAPVLRARPESEGVEKAEQHGEIRAPAKKSKNKTTTGPDELCWRENDGVQEGAEVHSQDPVRCCWCASRHRGATGVISANQAFSNSGEFRKIPSNHQKSALVLGLVSPNRFVRCFCPYVPARFVCTVSGTLALAKAAANDVILRGRSVHRPNLLSLFAPVALHAV